MGFGGFFLCVFVMPVHFLFLFLFLFFDGGVMCFCCCGCSHPMMNMDLD